MIAVTVTVVNRTTARTSATTTAEKIQEGRIGYSGRGAWGGAQDERVCYMYE